MKYYWLIIVILALIIGFVIINHSFEKKDVNPIVRYVEIKVYDPVYVGIDKGFFKEENVTVKFVGEMYGGPQMIQAISSGSADASTASIVSLINAYNNGFKIKAAWDMQTSTKSNPIHTWIVLNESNITKASDLKGKKIGVNALASAFHYMTLEYLKKNNVSAEEVTFIVIPHPNMEQALLSHQIDVAGMVTPYNEHLLQTDSRAHVLFNTVDIFGENMQSVVGIFSEKYLKENVDSAKRFLNAYKKSVDFIVTNPDESKEIMSNHLGVESKYIINQKFQPNTAVDVKSINIWIKILEDQKSIVAGSVKAADIIGDLNNESL